MHVAVLQGGAARRADCLHRRRPAADGVVPHERRHPVRAVRRRLHARLHRSVPHDAAAAEPREGRARHLPARRAHLVACCVHGDAHSVQPLACRDANLRIHRHVRDAAGALNDIPDVRVSQEQGRHRCRRQPAPAHSEVEGQRKRRQPAKQSVIKHSFAFLYFCFS